MDKLTLTSLFKRYNELISQEHDFPAVTVYYISDNNCLGTKEKPYKVKMLCSYLLSFEKNKNGKFELTVEQKDKFRILLLETYRKENIYLL